jgi:hypothetical protein
MSYSLGGRILDLFDDLGLKLLGGSPYFEKVASLPVGDPSKLASLDDRHFGVIFLTKKGEAFRKYPLNDLTNTVLSNVYFDLAHAQLPVEAKVAAATRIKQACELFGVGLTPAVDKFAAEDLPEGRQYVNLHKVASSSGGSVDLFKQLNDAYVENRDKYGRAERIELAQAMKEASSQFGFDVHDDLKPYALSSPVVDREALFGQCSLRKHLTAHEPKAAGLMDEFLQKHADFDAVETVKLLETFDRQFNLSAYWTRGLDPYRALTEKVAYHSVPVRGASLTFTDAELKGWISSNGDLVAKMFGKDLAEKIKADSSAVWSLPTASREFIAARIEHAREDSPVEAK